MQSERVEKNDFLDSMFKCYLWPEASIVAVFSDLDIKSVLSRQVVCFLIFKFLWKYFTEK